MTHPDWQNRVDAIWNDPPSEEELVDAIDTAIGDDPSALALFERGGARDSAGREAEAEAFYRRALAAGLPDNEHDQCIIQLASTVRNLGRAAECVDLLDDAFPPGSTRPLTDAALAFKALALADLGRPTEALKHVLPAFAKHLPRYARAVRAYAEELPR